MSSQKPKASTRKTATKDDAVTKSKEKPAGAPKTKPATKEKSAAAVPATKTKLAEVPAAAQEEPIQDEPKPEVKPATKVARAKAPTPVEIAMEKYTAAGWTIIKPPRGAVNDFMASRSSRFHFVLTVTKATIDDPKFHGEAKNSFVQNAFSNGAVPIFAHVVVPSSTSSKSKVTFEDVNTGDRVIVSTVRKHL